MHRVSLLIALLLVVPAIPGFVSVRSASGGPNALVATGEDTSGSLFRPSQYLPLALPGDQRTDAFPQPPALWGHAMAYDAQSDRVILFGGAIKYVGYRDETWTYDFDTNTWSDMRPPTKPSARFYHGMTYDAQSDRVILWGGAWESDGYFYPKDDTWAYDFEVNGWTDMRPTKAPPARFWLAIAYDSRSDRVIQFGGREQFLLDDHTWAYDFDTNTWTDMDPAQPPYAECPAIAYDSGSDRVVLFSEVYDQRTKTWTSMTWAYDFDRDRWTNMNPATQPPTVWCHAMAYDAQSDRVIVFGGNIGNSGVRYSDETWAYDFDRNTWTNMNPATRPSARAWHAMAYDAQSDRVILFGGYASDTGSNETWAYDFDTNTWTNMKLAQPPNRLPTLGPVDSVPAVALPGQEVRLTASASDPDGDVLTYTWDFGDGASATGTTAAGGGTITATHAYVAVGTYTVTLTVDDGKGGIASALTQVTVTLPIEVSIQASWTQLYPGQAMDLTVFATVLGLPLPGASAVGTMSAGATLAPAYGSTDSAGTWRTTVQPDFSAGGTTIIVSVTVDLAPYLPGTASFAIAVLAEPLTMTMALSSDTTEMMSFETATIHVRLTNTATGSGVPGGLITPTSLAGGSFSPVAELGDGDYLFRWTAPAVTGQTFVSIAVSAKVGGYTDVRGRMTILVDPNRTNPTDPTQLFLLTSSAASVTAGGSVPATVFVFTIEGFVVSGGTVTASLRGVGTLTVVVDELNGVYRFTYIAPASVASATNVLITITAIKTGYAIASTRIGITVLPAG